MNTHPLYNNLMDYRTYGGVASNLANNSANSMLNVIKPKPSIFSKLSNISLGKIGTILGGTQKVLNIYNQVTPIIRQTKPLIANIKTTLKVAKAFKRFSKEDSLEKAFDNLPDFEEQKKQEKDDKVIDIKESKKEVEFDYIDIKERKEDKKIPNPYFNMV